MVFGECHAHIMMDGENYRKAAQLHEHGAQEEDIRRKLDAYRKAGITYIRDGGDRYGVSERTLQIAEEYGIDYRTPLYAIHKKGHYGGIVGYGFETWKEYEALVRKVQKQGGHFIKIMISGIMDFSVPGKLSEEPLKKEEIRTMIRIAHEEGFSVMAHANGSEAVLHAVEAGVDSVEHGNFMNEDALCALAESGTVWVPTYVTITNLIGGGRFDDVSITRLKQEAGERIRRGFELGAKIALGSDGGAWRVPHGQGLLEEYRQICALMVDRSVPDTGQAKYRMTQAELDQRLMKAEQIIRRKF